jgi:hypothetical protein
MQHTDQVEVLAKQIQLFGCLPWLLFPKMFPLALQEAPHILTYALLSTSLPITPADY